jgi:hypothetical protein
MSSDNDNVVSIGDDFRQFDRKFWGWRDRARAQREDALTDHSKSWVLPGNTQHVPDTVASFQLHGPTKADEARRTRLNVKRLEEKLGRRPRTEW